MKTVKTLKIKYGSAADLIPAAEIIAAGGLVAFPTETVYGLGGNALDSYAAEKIYMAKGRPSDNPLIVHLASADDAGKYSHTCWLFDKIADAFMPGPITVIMPKKKIIPDSVTGGLGTVGIRVPSHPAARSLISLSGLPIAAPSANISGRPSPTSFEHVVKDLDGRIDCIIDGGKCQHGVESTIVMINRDEDGITLLRPGAVTPEMLLEITENLRIDPAVSAKFEGVPLAPGMKYRHYAPSKPLSIVDAEGPLFVRFVNERPGCGVICDDEDFDEITASYKISLGGVHDAAEHGRRLFDCLRFFDDPVVANEISVIYAKMPEKSGVGFAVFNRLVKAAGFSVIKPETQY